MTVEAGYVRHIRAAHKDFCGSMRLVPVGGEQDIYRQSMARDMGNGG